MRRLLAPRSRAVAFLEAGAASCVASLPERRREIIAAAVSAEQLLRFARRLGSARSGRPGRYGRSNLCFACGGFCVGGHMRSPSRVAISDRPVPNTHRSVAAVLEGGHAP